MNSVSWKMLKKDIHRNNELICSKIRDLKRIEKRNVEEENQLIYLKSRIENGYDKLGNRIGITKIIDDIKNMW